MTTGPKISKNGYARMVQKPVITSSCKLMVREAYHSKENILPNRCTTLEAHNDESIRLEEHTYQM